MFFFHSHVSFFSGCLSVICFSCCLSVYFIRFLFICFSSSSSLSLTPPLKKKSIFLIQSFLITFLFIHLFIYILSFFFYNHLFSSQLINSQPLIFLYFSFFYFLRLMSLINSYLFAYSYILTFTRFPRHSSFPRLYLSIYPHNSDLFSVYNHPIIFSRLFCLIISIYLSISIAIGDSRHSSLTKTYLFSPYLSPSIFIPLPPPPR